VNIVITALGIFIGGTTFLFIGILTFGAIAHKIAKGMPDNEGSNRLKNWREFIYRLF
jgi:hypothetical protein